MVYRWPRGTPATTTTDPRADRAHFIASSASQWLKCHTTAGKRYGIPAQSQPGRYYLVDTRVCDCPDFTRLVLGGGLPTGRPPMTDAERQARFRSRLRALATAPERLLSGNYRDLCADCGQIMVAPSIAELDGARCACPPTCPVQ